LCHAGDISEVCNERVKPGAALCFKNGCDGMIVGRIGAEPVHRFGCEGDKMTTFD
jgi:hypothetical protein